MTQGLEIATVLYKSITRDGIAAHASGRPTKLALAL